MNTTLVLTYVPTMESLHVYLNGIEQYEDADWVYNDGSAGGLVGVKTLTPMDVRSTDLLEARYAHRFETPPAPFWTSPTIVGTPYVNWIAGINGGHRSIYVRLEGLLPGRNPPYYNLQSTPGASGTWDGNGGAGNLGIAVFGANGTASNILWEDVVKPWYGAGEYAPTGIRVDITTPNLTLFSDQIQWGVGATGNPLGYGPPPPGWQGEIFAPNVAS